MDELERRLREDAARIEARVTPEFESRVRASLERVADEEVAPQRARRRPRSLWWASSVTGIAAAAAVIALINVDPSPEPEPSAVPEVVPELVTPIVPNLRPESAVLTAPLEQELENLESDLEKAGRAVREDIGIPL